MAATVLKDTKDLRALAIPLSAVVGAAVDKILERITVTTFKPGEGLWATIVEPLHVDDLLGIIIFILLSFAGYRTQNLILMLFGLGGLSGILANEVKEAISMYVLA